MIDTKSDRGERWPGRVGRDHRSRIRQAARHAEHVFPGPVGRLVAHELAAYAAYADGDHGPSPAGLAELVVREVLDRPVPRRPRARPIG